MLKELQSFLDKSFSGSIVKNVSYLTVPLKRGQTIPKGRKDKGTQTLIRKDKGTQTLIRK